MALELTVILLGIALALIPPGIVYLLQLIWDRHIGNRILLSIIFLFVGLFALVGTLILGFDPTLLESTDNLLLIAAIVGIMEIPSFMLVFRSKTSVEMYISLAAVVSGFVIFFVLMAMPYLV